MLTALAAGVVVDICYQAAAQWRARRRFPPPGEFVRVRGRQVHLWPVTAGSSRPETSRFLAGDGVRVTPTVVVLAALGTPSLEWLEVARRLAGPASVVLLDRPGLGWSEPAPVGHTVSAYVEHLDEVLTAAAPSGPLVLVGHSFGGLIARLYAQRHRARVAGLVLVDASHQDQLTHLAGSHRPDPARELLRLATRARLRPLGLQRALRDGGLRPRESLAHAVPAGWEPVLRALRSTRAARRTTVAEMRELAGGLDALRGEVRHLGDLPLLVVTAGPRGREQWWPAWDDLQRDHLSQSSRAQHVRMPEATHHAHHDDPAAVAAALRSFVEELDAAATS